MFSFSKQQRVLGMLAAATSLVVLGQSASSFAAPVTYQTGFESPMTLGSINGQDGWTVGNPNFVQAVTTAAAHSGSQSWLRSNNYTSGTFGDQPYSAPLPGGEKVGETTTSGATAQQNMFSFWFRSGNQVTADGSYVSVALSDSQGSRMNRIALDNSQAGGVRLLAAGGDFNDVQMGTLLSRTDWHQVSVATSFQAGPGNDVVDFFVDGNYAGTTSSWEDYYRFDAEQAGNGNQLFASDRVLFRTSLSPTANGGFSDSAAQGFYFDDFTMTTAVPEPTTVGAIAVAAVGLLARRRGRNA